MVKFKVWAITDGLGVVEQFRWAAYEAAKKRLAVLNAKHLRYILVPQTVEVTSEIAERMRMS